MTTLKKRTTIEKAVNPDHPDRLVIEEQIDPKDQPAVLAYRVGEVERAVREGFVGQSKKLDEMVKGFVTEKEWNDFKETINEEHGQLWGAIKGIKSTARWLLGTVIAAVVALGTLIAALRK